MAAADFNITKKNEETVLKDLATELGCSSKDMNTNIGDLRKELNIYETKKKIQHKLEELMPNIAGSFRTVCNFNSALKKNGLKIHAATVSDNI